MPDGPIQFRIYRWRNMPMPDVMEAFEGVGVGERTARYIMRQELIVEDPRIKAYVNPDNVTDSKTEYYFPRSLVEEVVGPTHRTRRKNRTHQS